MQGGRGVCYLHCWNVFHAVFREMSLAVCQYAIGLDATCLPGVLEEGGELGVKEGPCHVLKEAKKPATVVWISQYTAT